MKFVSTGDFRTSSAKIWEILPEEREMVITDNGKPIALLMPLSDATLENTLAAIKQAKAINALKSIQQESLKKGLQKTTMEEIDEEIRRIREEILHDKEKQNPEVCYAGTTGYHGAKV